MISVIVCADRNGAIGRNNELLDHFPTDLSRFKTLTTGESCVMGRKTFDSIIDKNGEPLLNRQTLVLTSYADKSLIKLYGDSVLYYDNIDDVLADSGDLFICGGSSVYKQFLPIADRIYLTIIDEEFEGADAYFPIDFIDAENGWHVAKAETGIESNGYEMSFITYDRKDD